mmetsp:Transcript_2967/g.7588  ORF Transcript_2967/g.7588 Transcript_2967/m.7588 type:complete len:346 (+) Transcript_2967:735-1772(+)
MQIESKAIWTIGPHVLSTKKTTIFLGARLKYFIMSGPSSKTPLSASGSAASSSCTLCGFCCNLAIRVQTRALNTCFLICGTFLMAHHACPSASLLPSIRHSTATASAIPSCFNSSSAGRVLSAFLAILMRAAATEGGARAPPQYAMFCATSMKAAKLSVPSREPRLLLSVVSLRRLAPASTSVGLFVFAPVSILARAQLRRRLESEALMLASTPCPEASWPLMTMRALSTARRKSSSMLSAGLTVSPLARVTLYWGLLGSKFGSFRSARAHSPMLLKHTPRPRSRPRSSMILRAAMQLRISISLLPPLYLSFPNLSAVTMRSMLRKIILSSAEEAFLAASGMSLE